MSKDSILIVEDERELGELLCEHLRREGFRVLLAHDAQSGLRLLRRHPPRLVLLDVRLPGMDGRDLCRQLRERHDIPVLFMTGKRETPQDCVDSLAAGGDDFLRKPFSPLELVARIRAILRRSLQTLP